MSASKTIYFANFICRFGEAAVLLDFAKEIVIPAFRSGKERKFGRSRYFFQGADFFNVGTMDNPELLLCGRFIQDTILTREQVLEGNTLIRSSASISSAPSALFALEFATHKLMYYPETHHAPSLQAFAATANRLIRDAHGDFIRQRFKESAESGEPRSKDQLLDELPHPSVEVVPLSSESSFAEFVDQFQVLKRIQIDLVEPNDELDTHGLVQAMRESQKTYGAKSAGISYANSSGLSQTEAASGLGSIAMEGNTRITLSGLDERGITIKGNNDSFRLGVSADNISPEIAVAGQQFYKIFKEKVNDGLLKVQQLGESAKNKIAALNKAIAGD